MALVVAQTADAGAPQAGLTITGLTGSCDIVITVSWDGGTTWNAVRGGTLTGIFGSTFIRDYVTPLNVTATYKAVVTGGTTATWTATSTIASNYAWIQDPLAPRSAIPLVMAQAPDLSALLLIAPSFSSLSRKQAVDYAQPMGARLPVASVGVRQAPSNVPLGIQADAARQGALVTSLRTLFDTSGQVVIRGLSAFIGLDAVAHVIVGDVAESPTTSSTMLGIFQGWQMNVTQARPVSTRVIVPWWTYDQVLALVQSQLSGGATTYTQVTTAQPAGKTYTDWLAKPGIAP